MIKVAFGLKFLLYTGLVCCLLFANLTLKKTTEYKNLIIQCISLIPMMFTTIIKRKFIGIFCCDVKLQQKIPVYQATMFFSHNDPVDTIKACKESGLHNLILYHLDRNQIMALLNFLQQEICRVYFPMKTIKSRQWKWINELRETLSQQQTRVKKYDKNVNILKFLSHLKETR